MSGEQIGHDGERIGMHVKVVAADNTIIGLIRPRVQ